MELSPFWIADSHSVTEEIPRLSWNPRFHYRVHKSPALVPYPETENPLHNLPTYFININFNIVLLSTYMYSESSLPSRYATKIF
jgi:hypothetical protein